MRQLRASRNPAAKAVALMLFVIPATTGLGFLSGGLGGALAGSAASVAICGAILLVALLRLRRAAATRGDPFSRVLVPMRAPIGTRGAILSLVAAIVTIATGAAWLASDHASGGAALIIAGAALALSVPTVRALARSQKNKH